MQLCEGAVCCVRPLSRRTAGIGIGVALGGGMGLLSGRGLVFAARRAGKASLISGAMFAGIMGVGTAVRACF